MKGVKCIGLLVLFAIPLLCLCQSSDVSAVKFDLHYIPFTVPYVSANNSHQFNDAFVFRGSTNGQDNRLKISDNYVFNTNYDEQSGNCIYYNYSAVRSDIDTYYISYYLQPQDYGYSGSDVPNYFPCYTDKQLPSNFVESSLPLYSFGYPNFRSYLPYRYNFNGIYLYDSYTNDNIDYSTRFEFSEIFENEDLPDDVYKEDKNEN